MQEQVPAESCHNCGYLAPDAYCGRCGQATRNAERPLRELVGEGLGAFFSLDSRLLRTLKVLLLRPGALSVDYFEGRRARYVPPLRLYLSVSLLFFILFAVLEGGGSAVNFGSGSSQDASAVEDQATVAIERGHAKGAGPAGPVGGETELPYSTTQGNAAQSAEASSSTVAEGEDLASADQAGEVNLAEGSPGAPIPDQGIEGEATAETESEMASKKGQQPGDGAELEEPDDPEDEDGWFVRGMSQAARDPERTNELFMERMPTVVFLLVPILAVVLWVLFRRQRRFYVEHLIFAFHAQTFVFLLLVVRSVVETLSVVEESGTPVVLAYPLYLLLGFRRFYDQGWLMISLKLMVFALVGLLLLTLGLLLGLVLTLLSL